MTNLQSAIPARIGSHYRVERLLGTGGLSQVFEVTDQRDGRRLALKQCRTTEGSSHARVAALFRQEFHILSQIKHPNVVEVYAYGFDGDQPYYTMECLEGRPVYELAPLDWQRTCSILLDLCTPLSLLHARRVIHCDITPRNVLITSAGTTKLIDFGALSLMDEPINIVTGTPPHMPPELVNRQALDGRVDVFGLGALAYWLLSRHHAYPAQTIRDLPRVWETSPPSLSELGVSVPPGLDALVMAMLSLDVAARPVQIAEVSQRLGALTGSTHTTDRTAIAAPLRTTRLVGRDRILALFRELHRNAGSQRGATLCLRGPKGSGRSRLIEACALEASLAESVVLRPTSEGFEIEHGLLAAILRAAVRHAPELANALPEALAAAAQGDDEHSLRALASALGNADGPALLADSMAALSERRTLVLLVDDLQRADVASLHGLLALTDRMRRSRMLLVVAVTEPAESSGRDLSAVFDASHVAQLDALALQDVRELLASGFGEVANLDELSLWAHRASAGLPGPCTELARYLVEQGIIRFDAGQFRIPADLSAAGVPQSIDEALDQRATRLEPPTRELLGALALVTPFAPLSVSEHLELLQLAGWEQDAALSALDALIDAQFICLRGDTYELRSDPIRQRALAWLEPSAARAWQLRLGAFYERRGHPRRLLSALHFYLAGDLATAYALVLPVDEKLIGPNDPNVPVGGSAQGIAMHEALLAYAIERGAPLRESLHLRRVLTMIGSGSEPRLGVHSGPLIEQLCLDTGLDLWDAASPELDEPARLIWCLGQAQERQLALPESARGFPVVDAIRQLAECGSALVSIRTSQLDVAGLAVIVGLIRRLRTLTPTLGILCEAQQATLERVSRGSRTAARYRQLIAALAANPPGMDEHLRLFMLGFTYYRLGADLAERGDEECGSCIAFLRGQARLAPHASSVGLLLALARGDYHEATRMRRERAIAVLASRHEDQHLMLGKLSELELLDACGDLLELQRMLAWFDARAARFDGWKPIAALAHAYYLFNCEDLSSTMRVLDEVLELAPPLQHAAWYELRALRAETALRAGDPVSAQARAEEVIELASRAGVDMAPNTRAHRTLALACAQRGDAERALAILEPFLREAEAGPLRTVPAAQILETRARIALLCGDEPTFETYLQVLRPFYRGSQPGLAAKLERLKNARRALRPRVPGAGLLAASQLGTRETSQVSRLQTDLDRLNVDEHADYLLSLLLAECGATLGHLYVVRQDGRPALAATRNSVQPGSALTQAVLEYLSALNRLNDAATVIADSAGVSIPAPPMIEGTDEQFRPVPLRGHDGTIRAIGLIQGVELHVRSHVPSLYPAMADALARLPLPR